MVLEDLKERSMIQDGRTALQVSTVGKYGITAQVLLTSKGTPPARTSVRSYSREEILQRLSWMTDRTYEKVEQTYRR